MLEANNNLDTAIYEEGDVRLGHKLRVDDDADFRADVVFSSSSSLENDIQRLKWSGRYIISGSVCSPSFRRTTTDDFIGTATIRSGAIGDNYQIRLTYPPSRTGIDTISITRDWLNPRKGDIFSPVFC